MENALELLHKAALRLAQEGPVKDRLAEAYHHYLSDLQPQQLPEDYRSPFTDMCRAMCSVTPLPRENPVRASVRKMSCSEANRYASLIVSLFGAVAREARVTAMPRSGVNLTPASIAPLVQLLAAKG
jgi:hypothetical protein